jgi:hypothetical protein
MKRTRLTSVQNFIAKPLLLIAVTKTKTKREKKEPYILLKLGTLRENSQTPRCPWVPLEKRSCK